MWVFFLVQAQNGSARHLPLSLAYASQCDDVLISLARIPKVRNEGEDFRRDLVDLCELVLPNVRNQAEDLESISLENVDLEHITHWLRSTHPFRWLASAASKAKTCFNATNELCVEKDIT